MAQSDMLQKREANLKLELRPATEDVNLQSMRYRMMNEYLNALFEMRTAHLENGTDDTDDTDDKDGTEDTGEDMEDIEYANVTDARKASKPYDQAVQSHAKVECLILATHMQIRLPRELRDLCYSYIWDEEYLQNTQERMVNSLSGKDFPHYGPKPHVIDPKYMDPVIAREVMEAYYRYTPSVGKTYPHQQLVRITIDFPSWIDIIIHNDVFGLGMELAQFLPSLRVNLPMAHLYEVEADMANQLGLLLEIEKKKSFKLDIAIQQRRVRLKQWDQLFAILTPIYREFEAAGAQVHVEWTYDNDSVIYDQVHSLDDLVRKWHPDLKWKDEAIAWLDRDNRMFRNICERHKEWKHEDKEGYDHDYFFEEYFDEQQEAYDNMTQEAYDNMTGDDGVTRVDLDSWGGVNGDTWDGV